MSVQLSQIKCLWTCAILQITFAILFFLLVRYHESADARHIENQLHKDEELHENIEKYDRKETF